MHTRGVFSNVTEKSNTLLARHTEAMQGSLDDCDGGTNKSGGINSDLTSKISWSLNALPLIQYLVDPSHDYH